MLKKFAQLPWTVTRDALGHARKAHVSLSLRFGGIETMLMKNHVGCLWGIVGIGLLTIPVVVAAGASDKPVTGDTVIRETQEAVRATKDYTIQQKDAFQRKVQTELDEMQVRIAQLRGQVKHASGKTQSGYPEGDRGIRKEKGLGQ